MFDVDIRGADDIARLVRNINQHADAKAIKREMFAGLNRATKPIREDMKSAAVDAVPSGYADDISRDFSSRTSAKGGRWAGVTIYPKAKRRALNRLNQGLLRHPLFGNRRFWFSQSTPEGFLDRALDQGKPTAVREVTQSLEEIARKVGW